MPAKKAKTIKPKAKTTKKAVSPVKKIAAIKEPLSKSQIITHLSESASVEKKQVKSVLESLADLVEAHIKKKGPGEMNFLGLFKLAVIKKPAKKARKGINPFTGEETMFAAKPAKNVVKVRLLKKVKDMVEA